MYEDNDEDNYLIHHLDLYRLPNAVNLNILNIPEIYSTSICLIEWPERMGLEYYPKSYLNIEINIKENNSGSNSDSDSDSDSESVSRIVVVTPSDERWNGKLEILLKIK